MKNSVENAKDTAYEYLVPDTIKEARALQESGASSKVVAAYVAL